MERPIIRDLFFLQIPSEKATIADLPAAQDLLDTLHKNRSRCVGLAANMIGVRKRIIAIAIGPVELLMLNPELTKKTGHYRAEEGCLSLDGVRPAERYQTIEVSYEDESFQKKKQVFQGFPAQVIQHELDHCNGILI